MTWNFRKRRDHTVVEPDENFTRVIVSESRARNKIQVNLLPRAFAQSERSFGFNNIVNTAGTNRATTVLDVEHVRDASMTENILKQKVRDDGAGEDG